jgi:hypothetical protein
VSKKRALLLCAALAAASAVFAQDADSAEDTGKGSGFTIELDLYADAFKVTNKTFAHTDIRVPAAQNTTAVQFPISSIDYWTDSKAALGYDGRFFGGNYSLTKDSIQTSGFGKLKGWLRYGFLRITAGNDIESIYADPLGADPGLRLYTGMSKSTGGAVSFQSENPDNITENEGLLIEAFFKPLTVALAAGEFDSMPNLAQNLGGTNTYGERYDTRLRYGARAGWELEGLGKLNVSYVIKGKTIADSYNYKGGNSAEIVPFKSNAQTWDHAFGLYGSFTLPGGFDLTAGYNGHVTSYLDEFYNNSQGWIKTGYPAVFKNGLNLNARYRMSGGVTIRTDHSLAFWKDKNYETLDSGNNRFTNAGLDAAEQADRYAEIVHFMMWNGAGLSWEVTERFTAGAYLRSLCAWYSTSGATPAGTGEYTLFRDQIETELKFLFRFNRFAEAFVKVKVQDLITSRSKDLNAQSSGVFIDYVNNNPSQGIKPVPAETLDNELSVSIPIGITLKFQ